MVRRTSLIVALGVVCPLGAGCGDDPERPSTARAKPSVTPTAKPDMSRFMLQAGDLPGLEPDGSPLTDSGLPFPELSGEGEEVLERSGYVSTTYRPAQGKRAGGVSSVLLFETEAGAREWMEFETSDEGVEQQIPGAKVKRFKVPDVPGAHGWTGPDRHGNAIGHVYWTQGRCMLLLGLETKGPRVEPLSAGAAAIHERTGGECP